MEEFVICGVKNRLLDLQFLYVVQYFGSQNLIFDTCHVKGKVFRINSPESKVERDRFIALSAYKILC